MYAETKNYLLEHLKASGLKSNPYTSQKALEKSQESHIGAVLFERETLERDGSKVHYKDETGVLKKRRKVFARTLSYVVILGDYTDEAVEEMYQVFLSNLDEGIYIDGNYVPITIESADWVDKDDNILKAKVAVQILVSFAGGVYRDTGFVSVKDLEIEKIERR